MKKQALGTGMRLAVALSRGGGWGALGGILQLENFYQVLVFNVGDGLVGVY